MEFTSPAQHYDRFMGRYTRTLAPRFADAAGIERGMRVLDVGCGPGGLAIVLAERVGADHVAAIDPADQFAATAAERVPGADVRVGGAEELPWEDGAFDAALASLVVAFMRDADRGIAEMARVTRPGGTVAACMWDVVEGGMSMLRIFWTAVHAEVESATGEARRPGTERGDLAARFERAGLRDVRDGELIAHADYEGFDDFWEPFTYAVGPAGAFLATLAPDVQGRIRERCREALPSDGPFTLDARAWLAVGTRA